jgi:hypothetical protein
VVRQNILRGGVAVVPVVIFLIVYSIYWPPDVPLIGTDSPGYLNFEAIRSGGYPFFLAALKPIVRNTANYVIVQYIFYGLAVLVFARELIRAEQNLLFCLVVEIGLLANWEVNRYHFSIISESPFLSISVLFLAAVLAHLRTGSGSSLAAASGFAAIAYTIRPTGVVFIGVLPFLAAASSRSFSVVDRSVRIILPLVIILAAESLYYRAYHSGPRESLLPTLLLGKAGMIDVADPRRLIDEAPSNSKALQKALEFQLAPVRQIAANAPSIAARCRLEIWYENAVEHSALAARAKTATAENLVRAELARVRMGFPGYLRLSADHLFCMWTVWATDKNESAALAAYIAAHKPLPFENDVLPHLEKARLPPFPILVRVGMLSTAACLALAGFFLLVSLCRGRVLSLELRLSGLCGIITHAGLIMSALLSGGNPALYDRTLATDGGWVVVLCRAGGTTNNASRRINK